MAALTLLATNSGHMMMLPRRRLVTNSASAILLALFNSLGHAEPGYPTKPIKLIVGAPPGGGPDNLARIVAQHMSLGQPVVIENRTGASSLIAAEALARAAADGYTIMIASQTITAVAPILQKTRSFDPQKNFTGVAFIGTAPLVLVAGPALPVNTVPEIIQLARSRPGSLDYANGGVGTTPYMAGALFSTLTGAKLNPIPYPGEQAAMTDIIGGRVPLMFANASAAMPHVKAGRLRGIAVTSAGRVDVAQGLPTVAESGVPGFEIGTWYGLIAPAGTPASIVDKLNAEVRRVLALNDVQTKLAAQGFILQDRSVAEFNQYLRSEHAKWSKLIHDAGIKAE
jgi:tripartite-type tricarboxylate transporter receptor subunit TctC